MQSSEELGTNPMLVCALHGCYGGGGAVQNLNSRKNESYALVHELKACFWAPTRAKEMLIFVRLFEPRLSGALILHLFGSGSLQASRILREH